MVSKIEVGMSANVVHLLQFKIQGHLQNQKPICTKAHDDPNNAWKMKTNKFTTAEFNATVTDYMKDWRDEFPLKLFRTTVTNIDIGNLNLSIYHFWIKSYSEKYTKLWVFD